MTGSDVTARDIGDIEAFLAAHRDVRVLQIVTGTNAQFALDVALHDQYIARIQSPNLVKTALGEITDIDAYLQDLGANLPTVAVTYYSKPVIMDVPDGDTSSETFRRRDRFRKLRRLHEFLQRRGVPIVMECGDMHSRLGDDHFYEEIRRFAVSGLIMNNRAAVDFVRAELLERGIQSVRSILWQPLGIDPAVHRDYGLPKRDNFLMYGRTDEAFRKTLRRYGRLRQALTLGRFGFVQLKRNTVDGDTLFERVNRARAAFAAHQSGGVYKGRPIGMTYAKYFEIPGCRTLLVGQPTPDLEHLGLIENEHYVGITPANYWRVLPRLAREITSPRIRAMTDRAHALVHEQHRIGQHVNETLKAIVRQAMPPAMAAR